MGCPWDISQDHKSIAHYCIEEAYELEDAILQGHTESIKKELGDLLLHIVFYSKIYNSNKFSLLLFSFKIMFLFLFPYINVLGCHLGGQISAIHFRKTQASFRFHVFRFGIFHDFRVDQNGFIQPFFAIPGRGGRLGPRPGRGSRRQASHPPRPQALGASARRSVAYVAPRQA